MKTKERATADFILSVEDRVKESQAFLKENRKKVKAILPWVTEATKEELELVENYFIHKYQALPALKSFLKDPTLVSMDTDDL